MMKYLYKGTPEQLIENGFIPDKKLPDKIYTRITPGQDEKSEIIIFMHNSCLYPKGQFLFNYERYERTHLKNRIAFYIQDLIAAGLVEVKP